jgi:regulator of sirC expression with transglutaminase-like and TPR domain
VEGSPREAFAQLAAQPDARIDVARGALLIAAEEYPNLDVEAYLARLDELAHAAAARMGGAASRAGAERLCRYLFGELGFAGNRERYDDPRNSYLNEVLERRTGLPITLCLVFVEVARRLGLPAHGVGFPGHFLVKIEASPDVLVDAFAGRLVSPADCEARLRAVLGQDARLVPAHHLRAATPREILARMLANLKHVHLGLRDLARALACCERILLLVPDAAHELRDRGLLFAELECFAAAAADLRRFLELAPGDASAEAVRARLAALGSRTQLH